MVMTTKDLQKEPGPVAETTKKTEAPKAETKAAPALGRASESGDAAVQNLLGEHSVHASNGNDEGVADVERRLAELGYRI